jgi:hypothetical protein
MSLFRWLAPSWRSRTRLEDLAKQIARSHWVKVWERLSDDVWQMSRHERRGYIRARGALLIQQAVQQVIRQRQLGSGALAKLYALTMDQVVSHVTEHMAHCLPQAKTRRRAA